MGLAASGRALPLLLNLLLPLLDLLLALLLHFLLALLHLLLALLLHFLLTLLHLLLALLLHVLLALLYLLLALLDLLLTLPLQILLSWLAWIGGGGRRCGLRALHLRLRCRGLRCALLLQRAHLLLPQLLTQFTPLHRSDGSSLLGLQLLLPLLQHLTEFAPVRRSRVSLRRRDRLWRHRGLRLHARLLRRGLQRLRLGAA